MELSELKRVIFADRPLCELCNRNRATELHHCLVHDMKRYHKELTVPENLMAVCSYCHTSLSQQANSYEVRVQFAQEQIRRHYNISKWYRSLPLKYKEQWLLDLEKETNEHQTNE